MTSYWNVPYVGQVGSGADEHGNDCGAASEAMVKRYFLGDSPTVDALYNAIRPSGDSYLSVGELLSQLTKAGIPCQWDAGIPTTELYSILAEGVPGIALIRYGALNIIRPNNFTGSHFVVVIGMDLDTVYIHDPLNTPTSGECIKIPVKTWEIAWSTVGDDNPQRSLIIPSKPSNVLPVIPAKILKTVTPRDCNGCSVRKIPGLLTDANRVYAIPQKTKGVPTRIDIYQINADNWGKISPTRDEWILLDFTVEV